MQNKNSSQSLALVYVWSKKIRLFHWLNVLCVFLLITFGLIILNSKALGVTSDGKVLLKTCHVLVGYIFCINLLLRYVLGFFGTGFEKWSATLAFNKGFAAELKEYRQGAQKAYQGHNPAGKLMITVMFLALSIQMVSGLVIAGTDIYYPPFGGYFKEQIAIDSTQVELIKPYTKENVDTEKYKAMRDLRSPFITMHVYSFYLLLLLIPLHIAGVIYTERKEKSSITSAMINGYKTLPKD
ncbi:cytochrome b/b6 domain-containing protein [Thalassotalea psychrophila]|uniref:Cytochrome b/b6 domain-containing protein n=1 Tax=Thalassotalea psychrophila TaxID=3065647 RepID=A0ABY9TPW8_9GAMM|nr:cytochrome b/b6 domain-containing protein [Colwelliaceae bacterium SQ149]